MDCWSYGVLISEYQPFEFLNIYISLTASDLGFRILTCYLTMLSVWLSDAAPTSLSVFCFCRQHDFGKKKFSERTVLLCDQVSSSITSIHDMPVLSCRAVFIFVLLFVQCGREYHVGCLKEHNMADLTVISLAQYYILKILHHKERRSILMG